MSEEKDIVERLEWLASDNDSDIGLAPSYMFEAAAEIQRLRGEVERLRECLAEMVDKYPPPLSAGDGWQEDRMKVHAQAKSLLNLQGE